MIKNATKICKLKIHQFVHKDESTATEFTLKIPSGYGNNNEILLGSFYWDTLNM